MNNFKKVMSHLLVFGLLAGTAFSSAFLHSKEAKVETNGNRKEATVYNASSSKGTYDFSNEVELNYDELDVALTGSTTTPTSQAIDVNFRARTSVGFSSAKTTYAITVDDDTFNYNSDSGTEGSKRVYTDEHKNFNENGIPVFKGTVYLVFGGTTSDKKNVYIPETIKQITDTAVKKDEEGNIIYDDDGKPIIIGDAEQGDFIVEVESIASHAVTVDGAQYKKRNKWSRVTNIYIPKTIINVDVDAFAGYNTATDNANIYIESEKDEEGHESTDIPSTFAEGWTDVPEDRIHVGSNVYSQYENPEEPTEDELLLETDRRFANTSMPIKDLEESENYFVGGTIKDQNGNDVTKPLIIEYQIRNNSTGTVTKHIEELPLKEPDKRAFDAVGEILSRSYARDLNYRLTSDEEILDETVVLHNIMHCTVKGVLDQYDGSGNPVTYYAIPRINYSTKRSINDLVSYKATGNATFAGYSLFAMSMDKTLVPANDAYPFEHSLYMDVMASQYNQHKSNIEKGLTHIRTLIANLYKTSYYFEYLDKNGNVQPVEQIISTDAQIYTQDLTKEKGNLVSILLKNSAVAKDFDPERVIFFEFRNLNMQMDLQGTSSAGTVVNLGAKTAISYRFGYVTVIDHKANPHKLSVFNYNIFLIVFLIAFMIAFAGGAFALYKILKERFKNDEFRRVNGKKFLIKSILGGLGSTVILTSILFIIMRTTGFKNSIPAFNPADPLLIGFTIAGAIILGYFIVYFVKMIKAEQERRKTIRLKLNEDVEDDGTN